MIEAAKICNESRYLLKQLYDFRKLDNPPITGAETLEVLNACFRLPKDTFNTYLKELLKELRNSGIKHECKARLMIVGSVLNNPEFIRSIEELDSLVVTDELCSSTRYWSDPVIMEQGEPPLRAIARRYLGNFPCARMVPSEERFNRIIDLAKSI